MIDFIYCVCNDDSRVLVLILLPLQVMTAVMKIRVRKGREEMERR